jgi:hypothetical protein
MTGTGRDQERRGGPVRAPRAQSGGHPRRRRCPAGYESQPTAQHLRAHLPLAVPPPRAVHARVAAAAGCRVRAPPPHAAAAAAARACPGRLPPTRATVRAACSTARRRPPPPTSLRARRLRTGRAGRGSVSAACRARTATLATRAAAPAPDAAAPGRRQLHQVPMSQAGATAERPAGPRQRYGTSSK